MADLVYSDERINYLLSMMSSSRGEEKATHIELFNAILSDRLYDPSKCLALSLRHLKTKEDIGIVVTCLINNADPNLYMNIKDIGPVHVLYAINYLLDETLFRILYHVMVTNGSDGDLNLHNYSKHISFDEYSFEPSPEDETVFSKLTGINRNLNEQEQMYLQIFTNQKSVDSWNISDLEIMIVARNSEWENIKTDVKDSLFLKLAFKSTFYELLDKMIKSGIRPNYFDMWYFITRTAKIYGDPEMHLLREIYKDMLVLLIKTGVSMDVHQFDQLAKINEELKVTTSNEYNGPLWVKVCSREDDDYLPAELNEAALIFNITPGASKSEICNTFREIASSRLEDVISHFKNINVDGLTKSVSTLSDFISNSVNDKCYNEHESGDDFMEFSEKTLAYYRDNEGKIWCFTSNTFRELVDEGINPINKKPLPIHFSEIVRHKIHFLERNNIDLNDPQTISTMMKRLTSVQKVSSDESNEKSGNIEYLLKHRGFSKDRILNMKIKELAARFRSIGIVLTDYIETDIDDEKLTLSRLGNNLSGNNMYILIALLLFESFEEKIDRIDMFAGDLRIN